MTSHIILTHFHQSELSIWSPISIIITSVDSAMTRQSASVKRQRQTFMESVYGFNDSEIVDEAPAKHRRRIEKRIECSCGCKAKVTLSMQRRHLEKKGCT